MKRLEVRLKHDRYPIFVGPGAVKALALELEPLAPTRRVRVVTDQTVWRKRGALLTKALAGRRFRVDVFEVPAGEESKSLDVARELYAGLAHAGALRNEPILAFGGGVTGDLAGFVAATYMRGVPYAQIPTSLLAQVDSSVGGKVGVNLPAGKNLVGCFYQPRFVVIDTEMLETLPARELKSGLVEVIKCGFLKGERFLSYLEKSIKGVLELEPGATVEVIRQSCAFKAALVEQDERDMSGVRAVLNYGHTVGHAIERLTTYRGRHGEAVAVGLATAALIARKLGLIDSALVGRHLDLLSAASLSAKLPGGVTPEALARAIALDKKRRGPQRSVFVLLKGVGEPVLREVEPAVVLEALKELKQGG